MTSHTVAFEPTENSRSSRYTTTDAAISLPPSREQPNDKTHCDAVPVLVHHHDAEEHAQREEEQAVDVVLDRVAYRDREREEDDLRDREERRAEHDVPDRPAVLERAEHKHELRDDVHDRAHQRPQDVDDPEPDRLRVVEPRDLLECRDRDEEGHAEDDERRYPQELGRRQGAGSRTRKEIYTPIVTVVSRLLRIGNRRSR